VANFGECLALYHGKIGEDREIWRTWRNLETVEKFGDRGEIMETVEKFGDHGEIWRPW